MVSSGSNTHVTPMQGSLTVLGQRGWSFVAAPAQHFAAASRRALASNMAQSSTIHALLGSTEHVTEHYIIAQTLWCRLSL